MIEGDRGGRSARRGLKPKFYESTQTMVTAAIFPFKEKIATVEPGIEPGTSWLVVRASDH